MASAPVVYPVRLEIDYPERLDRFTTFFRLIWIIPIAVVAGLLTTPGPNFILESGRAVRTTGGGVAAGLAMATALMIVFRQRYPRWWFDFARELARFQTRIGAYFVLVTDRYPSTTDDQAVHLEIDYPDVERNLNRWLPLVKWLLAIPHVIVLALLAVVAVFVVTIAWFAILFTERYPRGLFDFVVGVARWALRVNGYAVMLVTDEYPPFTLR